MRVFRKRFSDLSNIELYRILKLRVDVFVVEQECPYPELDGLDQEAVHVWIDEEGEIVAYLRVLNKGVESEYAAIGRVISAKRNQGYGRHILKEGYARQKKNSMRTEFIWRHRHMPLGFMRDAVFRLFRKNSSWMEYRM